MVKRGDVVRAFGLTKHNRPGIVLRLVVDPATGVEYAYIAFATTQRPPPGKTPAPRRIDQSNPLFTALDLSDVSWFVVGNADRVRSDDKRITVIRQCPPAFFLDLLKMYGFK